MWGQNSTGRGKARAERSENDSGQPHVGPVHAGISQLPHSLCDIPSRRAGPNSAGRGTQPAAAQTFNAEQLDALLASIALYPDELPSQVLMASTFPLEVVAASRWVEDPAHKSLSGDPLVKALEAEPWDPSVKSLVPIPAASQP